MSQNPIEATGLQRKAIYVAGVFLLQPNAALASLWQSELADFGMAGVTVVASAEELLDLLAARPCAGLVIALPHREAVQVMAAVRAAGHDDLPAILVDERPSRALVAAAAKAGFDAVLPFPLPSRLIYRRMGSLMQRARRKLRARGDNVDHKAEEAV